MNVIFQSRRDLLDDPGGDTVIAEKLREALVRRGLRVRIDCAAGADVSGYDRVHLFNVAHRDCHAHARNARRQGRPLVVTPIYWNQDEVLAPHSRERSDYRERFRTRFRRHGWTLLGRLGLMSPAEVERRRERSLYYALGAHGMARAVCGMAGVLLPGSPSEREVLCRDFRVAASRPMVVAPYGIDPELFAKPVPEADNRFLREHGVRDFLLCVGRVERRKNQQVLLDAVRDLGLPVVLVGSARDPDYAAGVRQRLRPGDLWLESWPHASMAEVYSLARLHALPSFNETPGLVSLEAGALGVPVVVGNRGSERDYLGDHADSCDPGDPRDIRRACQAALARPRPAEALAAHVHAHFTWDRSAERVLEAYARVAG